MLTIYGRRNSLNVQKVMWAVGELGLAHVRKDVGGSFGGNQTDEYRALNPNGLVPTVDDDCFIMWESNACVRYLAAAYGAGTLWPSDAQKRGLADQWMDWQATSLYSTFGRVFIAVMRTPAAERNADALNADVEATGRLYQQLDEHLAGSAYIAGDAFTMGDIPLGCVTWRYFNMQINGLEMARPALPNVEAWYGRLRERAAYQQHVCFPFGTTPEEWTRLEQAGVGK